MKIKQLTDKINDTAESYIYTWLCVGIVYSLVFWPLLNSILCITLFFFWLLFSKKQFSLASGSTRLMLLFGSLYIISVIGMLYTANKEEGMFRLQQKAAMLVFPLVFGTTHIITTRILKKIMVHFTAATVMGCLISLGYGFFRFFRTGEAEMLTHHNLVILQFMHPYMMGMFCLLSIIIILDQFVLPAKNKQVFYLLLLALLSVFVFLLSTRLIIAAWFAIVLFYSFKYITTALYRIVTSLAMLLLIAIAIFTNPALKNQWKELTNFSGNNTIQLDKDESLGKSWGGKAIRLAIWQCSFDVIRTHWLPGVGTGDVQDSLQQAYENRKFYFASGYNRFNAHNEYIQTLLGNGIAGLLILIACIVIPLLIMPKHELTTGYYLFLFLFFAICLTESVLNTNKGVVWYSFFNSIFAFTLQKHTNTYS